MKVQFSIAMCLTLLAAASATHANCDMDPATKAPTPSVTPVPSSATPSVAPTTKAPATTCGNCKNCYSPSNGLCHGDWTLANCNANPHYVWCGEPGYCGTCRGCQTASGCIDNWKKSDCDAHMANGFVWCGAIAK
ncbi:hypothetical protein SPRG_12588 [Saprolegnia parasitica CBS 223.65]|uniref:ShKT domain-containing protein n=1 Tax=Saprolegnia parasitica (strain CBS 223.65) TaxID=695850 RepID=A0A067BWF6_SAPPC|nr:hypothetical protein SPRG_12588 [Saprolegnia parasitica CBS 223.65]KDO22608.1 hypothetical protein SPRG_12588 [Saprolegnia parasitica CBS 223.65]|eukprot:XP_012206723.1 hypothetical protein SPRG_12588 [Saprolegnia parasitica CBS 223.65]